MSRFFSEKFAELTPYTPGEQPQDKQYIKLNTNESPFPPSEKAQQAAAEEGITPVQMEARQIGCRIRELMRDMPVSVGEEFRPLEYTDICILLRGRTHLATYVKELAAMGIPAAADKGEGFLSTPEVQTALSLLRVIDNPLREIELTLLNGDMLQKCITHAKRRRGDNIIILCRECGTAQHSKEQKSCKTFHNI